MSMSILLSETAIPMCDIESALLSWGPIILSVIAIIVAIIVPARIAKKQNRIAVFDKLYGSYSQFLIVKSFAGLVEDSKFTGNILEVQRARAIFCAHFETSFGYQPDINDYTGCIGQTVAALRKNEVQAYMLPLLATNNKKQKEKCAKMIEDVYEPLYMLTVEVLSPKSEDYCKAEKHIKEFVSNCRAFSEKYSDVIEKALLCGKKA